MSANACLSRRACASALVAVTPPPPSTVAAPPTASRRLVRCFSTCALSSVPFHPLALAAHLRPAQVADQEEEREARGEGDDHEGPSERAARPGLRGALPARAGRRHLSRGRGRRRRGRAPNSAESWHRSVARKRAPATRSAAGGCVSVDVFGDLPRDAQHRLDRRLPEAPHQRGVRCPASTTAWRRRYSSRLSRATPALTIGAGRPRLLRQGPRPPGLRRPACAAGPRTGGG